LPNDSLIFDIGCNNGEDSEFYLKKGFTVVAVEANPASCAELRRRFAGEIAAGRFSLVDKAIAEQAGEITFYLKTADGSWGTTRSDYAERSTAYAGDITTLVVEAVKFSTLLENLDVPYYLKIDIEGSDVLCLEGLLSFSERPQFISVERDSSFARQYKELGLLNTLGYRRFQMIDQTSIPKQIPPNPAREGNYFDYKFRLGNTGLFGKELPGPWLTYHSVVLRNADILVRNGLFRKIPGLMRFAVGRGSWYDIHAALPARH
jgi:FkbM family methyltransferase